VLCLCVSDVCSALCASDNFQDEQSYMHKRSYQRLCISLACNCMSSQAISQCTDAQLLCNCYYTLCRHVTISGHVSAAARSTAVCDFNSGPQIRVALLTTGSAAAGLTLTAAQTVYLLEPAFSTVDEAQVRYYLKYINRADSVLTFNTCSACSC
jgi:hypothetical protein